MRLNQLVIALVGSVLLVFVGAVGYMVIEGWSFMDGLYMTVISVTTVGYGETHPMTPIGRIFTMILLFAGVGLILFIVTRLAEVMVEGNIRRVLGRRQMDKEIRRLKNHYIICGYGRIGRLVNSILCRRGLETVVVERSAEVTAQLEEEGARYVLGEATADEILVRAGIEEARGLVAAVDADADNVYIALTSRGLNPDLFIMARAREASAEQKLLRAGADKVILPNEIGARRMAQAILRPTVTDFLDLAVADDRRVAVQMEELRVGPEAKISGKALKDSGIRADLNLIVVAIKRPDNKMLFNPGPEDVIEVGSTLIVIGPTDKLDRLSRLIDAAPG